MAKYFKEENEYIYCDAQSMEFYIPMYYFDDSTRFATDFSDTIRTFGIFNVGIFENGKQIDMRVLNVPTDITIYVPNFEIRDVTMSNGETLQCKVVKYIKGSKIMIGSVFQDSANTKNFIDRLISGKIPSIIPYSSVLSVFDKNSQLNGVNFGLSSLYEETLISAVYRDKDDLSKKYSLVSKEKGDFGYTTASIRQICQYNSTFTALTFEDIDSMITTSLNKTRMKAKEVDSPIEQIIKY